MISHTPRPGQRSAGALSRRALLAAAGAFALAAPHAAFAQEGKPIRIGVLTDMSSLYADVTGKGSVAATQMAVEDFNAAGKPLKVEIIAADHQNKADVAASIARKWFDTDGVDMIVDVPNSAVALAVSSIAREKNKVMIASGPSSSDLTGKACAPTTVHWTYDTYALATGAATAVVESGGKSWFTLTADYAFGHAMEQDVKNVVARTGGKVIGGVRAPLNTQDFSSFLLQAQSSGAQVVGLINAGGDTINSIKQAVEFGIPAGGQRLVATVLYITDVHSLGLKTAQGLQFTESFYWDLNDGTRAWTKRFTPRNDGRYPSALHAGAYASTLHYLKAVSALGSAIDGTAVVDKMKALPTDDPLFGKGSIRVDGRKIHPMFLFQVKKPEESKYPWDYYNVIKSIPPEQVWRPLSEGGCPLVKS
ncbi:ABC transporter substrate-binding protein [Xanthobacter dioxanivorans]|uniref:ABC transporter substrate-binding protein n=1 Tax=Xanthobacter dioxanivorans TaxID=2528964 RepID=A0A974PM46_9HYPH|nr:ABC transporter substrate-binding protein [Xanthobacter dioxanivorans]QRG05716.1 ABC transporter substrate-binding protein [Xanthobacter dioxanivorans]